MAFIAIERFELANHRMGGRLKPERIDTMHNKACRYGILGSILVGGLFWGNSASASGIATARFGAEHGTPVSTNPTAIYYNPAAIAFAEHDYQVYLDVSLALRNASYTHRTALSDKAEPVGAEGANTDKARLFNVLAIPMFGATAKFGDLAIAPASTCPSAAPRSGTRTPGSRTRPTPDLSMAQRAGIRSTARSSPPITRLRQPTGSETPA